MSILSSPLHKYLLFFFALILCAHLSFAVDQTATKEKSSILQTIELLGTSYQAGLQKVELAPGGEKPLHMHTGPEVGYVLKGEITLTPKGQPPQVIQAGGSFQIQAHVPHTTKAGSKGATVLATWVVEKGKTFSVPSTMD